MTHYRLRLLILIAPFVLFFGLTGAFYGIDLSSDDMGRWGAAIFSAIMSTVIAAVVAPLAWIFVTEGLPSIINDVRHWLDEAKRFDRHEEIRSKEIERSAGSLSVAKPSGGAVSEVRQ